MPGIREGAVVLMLQQDVAEDFVIASGKQILGS